MIERISPRDVLADCRETLGLPQPPAQTIDDPLLAGLLRRSAGFHCPCSRATLRASVLECTQHLSGDLDSLTDRIEDAIEALIVGGDLLILSDVATDDPEVRGTWVFPAPPGFVIRQSGSAFLFGVVPDQDTYLPDSLSKRVVHEGFTRMIAPLPGEKIAQELHQYGLQELSEGAWLRQPRPEPARDMVASFRRQLAAQPRSAEVVGLEILDSQRPVKYYRGRWTPPTDQTGSFVGRRPQEFGFPIWCFVEILAGEVVRLLDLPLKATRWRDCDTAWHLQMAIDRCEGHPQLYRRRRDDGGVRFDFYSPLPMWSQRRLAIFGSRVAADRSLLAFRLPTTEANIEEQALQDHLWLSPTEDSE
ncbi:MAG: hypothetical protein F4X98_07675 [Gammaproteobacteria bacterium]|nr:hypothetical protein [Gammaproteobacteria bacterium]